MAFFKKDDSQHEHESHNLIDLPVGENTPAGESAKDDLGVERYVKGLANFIRNCDTPTTIAIQGEWGSGKTSMMNLLRQELCLSDNAKTDAEHPFYGIWLNIWKHSLMRTPEQTMLAVISYITNYIADDMSSRYQDKLYATMDKLRRGAGKWLGSLAKIGVSGAANYLSGGIINVSGAMQSQGRDEADTSPDAIQQALRDAIQSFIKADKEESNNPTKGFVFFIDDLDRMEPEVAVNVLELLKNVFEVPNCVFILAIDYEVVVKGLRAKFKTEKIDADNERQFRSFFDKIIQLPFNMPQSNYQLDNFLKTNLDRIGYLKEHFEFKDDQDETGVIKTLTNLLENSTGRNPRSIKRLINSLSLIGIMQQDPDHPEDKRERLDEILNFGLVCLQIAYQPVYRLLQTSPDFMKWNDVKVKEQIFSLFDLGNTKAANSTVADSTDDNKDNDDESSDPWSEVLSQMCVTDVYLKRNLARINNMFRELFNVFKKADKQDELGNRVSRILKMSSVTSVDTAKTAKTEEEAKAETPQDAQEAATLDPMQLFAHKFRAENEGVDESKVNTTCTLMSEAWQKIDEYIDHDQLRCEAGSRFVIKVKEPKDKRKDNICFTYNFSTITPGRLVLRLTDPDSGETVSYNFSSMAELPDEFFEKFERIFKLLDKNSAPLTQNPASTAGTVAGQEQGTSSAQAQPEPEESNEDDEGTYIKTLTLADDDLNELYNLNSAKIDRINSFTYKDQPRVPVSKVSVFAFKLITLLDSDNPAVLPKLAEQGWTPARQGSLPMIKSTPGGWGRQKEVNGAYINLTMNTRVMLYFLNKLMREFEVDPKEVTIEAVVVGNSTAVDN